MRCLFEMIRGTDNSDSVHVFEISKFEEIIIASETKVEILDFMVNLLLFFLYYYYND